MSCLRLISVWPKPMRAIDPRLPEEWQGLTYRITLRDTRVRVDVRQADIELTVEDGDRATVFVRGERVTVQAGEPVLIALDHQGPRLPGAPRAADVEGNLRADGSVITSSLPTISLDTSEAGLLEPLD